MLQTVVVHHISCCCRWCASGCVVECRICNREVAGSNLGRGYFAPRSTQPSIPPGSVNEYHLRLGRQRQVWLTPIADERVGVQVKLWNPSRTRAIPERFCGGDSLRRGAISRICTFTFTFILLRRARGCFDWCIEVKSSGAGVCYSEMTLSRPYSRWS